MMIIIKPTALEVIFVMMKTIGANLRNMRQFYLTYAEDEICYTLCSKLSWSHNKLIMRVSDRNAREYYLKEAILQQWTVRQTEREIQSFSYQRVLANQGTYSDGEISGNIGTRSFIKDPYVLEFIGLPFLENPVEKSLDRSHERILA